jgi:hypothetical protein
MTRRIDHASGEGVLVDCVPTNETLEIVQSVGPQRFLGDDPFESGAFAGVYLGGRRQYDIEAYVDGVHMATVPPRDVFVDDLYDQLEAVHPDQPG